MLPWRPRATSAGPGPWPQAASEPHGGPGLGSWPPGKPFGLSNVAGEINRRYRERLRKPVDPRMVSVHLRRRLANGTLVSVERGRPHHEALYARPE